MDFSQIYTSTHVNYLWGVFGLKVLGDTCHILKISKTNRILYQILKNRELSLKGLNKAAGLDSLQAARKPKNESWKPK